MHRMTKTILIIDDDVVFRKVLHDALSTTGLYTIAQAANGEEGLQKATAEKVDLILLDLVMPKIDGMQFLKRLRENERLARMPVLIISQLSDIQKIAEGAELGVKGYIVKAEMNLDQIRAQIERVIEETERENAETNEEIQGA